MISVNLAGVRGSKAYDLVRHMTFCLVLSTRGPTMIPPYWLVKTSSALSCNPVQCNVTEKALAITVTHLNPQGFTYALLYLLVRQGSQLSP